MMILVYGFLNLQWFDLTFQLYDLAIVKHVSIVHLLIEKNGCLYTYSVTVIIYSLHLFIPVNIHI